MVWDTDRALVPFYEGLDRPTPNKGHEHESLSQNIQLLLIHWLPLLSGNDLYNSRRMHVICDSRR